MANIDVQEIVKKVLATVERYPVINDGLTKASEVTNISKEFILAAVVAIPLLILLARGNGGFLIDLVGFIYPVIQSIKAIESETKTDDTMWLTYWIVFSFFKVIEGIFDIIISAIPFYTIAKLAFLVWCYHPKSEGAKILYEKGIKPHIVPLLGSTKSD